MLKNFLGTELFCLRNAVKLRSLVTEMSYSYFIGITRPPTHPPEKPIRESCRGDGKGGGLPGKSRSAVERKLKIKKVYWKYNNTKNLIFSLSPLQDATERNTHRPHMAGAAQLRSARFVRNAQGLSLILYIIVRMCVIVCARDCVFYLYVPVCICVCICVCVHRVAVLARVLNPFYHF